MMTTEQTSNTMFDIEQAKQWITKMGDRGTYQPTTARLRVTAIERLTSVLDAEEPRTVAYVLERLTELTDRWMKKEAGNRETAVTYRSRAKVALEDFLAFQENPTSWRPKSKAVDPEKKVKAPELKLVDAEVEETAAPASPRIDPPAATTDAAPRPVLDRCVLGEGAEFLYKLPDRGLEVKDVLRIALNLLSQTRDFDLSDPMQRSLFALARGDK